MSVLKPVRVFLVGPGRLGCSLGHALADSEHYVVTGVAYHSTAGRDRARRWMPGAGLSPMSDPEGLDRADLVIMALRDDVIRPTARTLQPYLRDRQVVMHTSGYLSSLVFNDLGIPSRVGTFHPLQTFADPRLARERFLGCSVTVEGEPEALAVAEALAQHLGARSVILDSGAKPIYHAAAVFASNYLVAITVIAVRLLASAGIEAEEALRMLLPLQQGTLENLSELGIPHALTGPVVRGDMDTIQAHLAAIARAEPEVAAIYRQLGLVLLDLARDLGQTPEVLASLETLLRAPSGPTS